MLAFALLAPEVSLGHSAFALWSSSPVSLASSSSLLLLLLLLPLYHFNHFAHIVQCRVSPNSFLGIFFFSIVHTFSVHISTQDDNVSFRTHNSLVSHLHRLAQITPPLLNFTSSHDVRCRILGSHSTQNNSSIEKRATWLGIGPWKKAWKGWRGKEKSRKPQPHPFRPLLPFSPHWFSSRPSRTFKYRTTNLLGSRL